MLASSFLFFILLGLIDKEILSIEVPIIFYDRTIGESKMSKKIIIEAIVRVPIFRLKRIFGL